MLKVIVNSNSCIFPSASLPHTTSAFKEMAELAKLLHWLLMAVNFQRPLVPLLFALHGKKHIGKGPKGYKLYHHWPRHAEPCSEELHISFHTAIKNPLRYAVLTSQSQSRTLVLFRGKCSPRGPMNLIIQHWHLLSERLWGINASWEIKVDCLKKTIQNITFSWEDARHPLI